MYELSVETEFCAAHSLLMQGQREPVHGHNWHVTLTLWGDGVDADGLVCDFHAVETALRSVTEALDNRDLNTLSPFDQLNPTAEYVARHIAESVHELLGPSLPPGSRVASCRVTEAPGCSVTYFRPTE